MSDLKKRNAKAVQTSLEDFEKRVRDLETEMKTLVNQTMTLSNLVREIQQTNALALAQFRGTGPTSGNLN